MLEELDKTMLEELEFNYIGFITGLIVVFCFVHRRTREAIQRFFKRRK